MRNINKKGISLIVLVITIVITVILSGIVIINIIQNDPIEQATKAKFQMDLRNFQTELDLYYSSEIINDAKKFEPSKLKADETSVTYDGQLDVSRTIYNIIPSLAKVDEYRGKLEIEYGELIYKGVDTKEQNWASEIGLNVPMDGTLRVSIVSASTTKVSKGIDVIYTINFSSNVGLTNIDLENKIEIIYSNGSQLMSQPTLIISEPSGTSVDTERSVSVTIATDSLEYGEYKVKVKAGALTDANNATTTKDTISSKAFMIEDPSNPSTPPNDPIDTTPPEEPTIVSTPTGWTNGNVTVTITYPADAAVKQYSTDLVNWNIYTSPINVSTNNTIIYAKCSDAAGNESSQAMHSVTNIDKLLPTVAFGTNGGNNLSLASTTVTVSDTGGSNVNLSTLEYVWDIQDELAPSSGWTTFTNGATITKNEDGTYYLWVKASDNAGNNVVSKTNSFTIDNTPPANPTLVANPTGWTNGNVTVTITYPADATVKQYSLNGTSWSNYTSAVSVTTNNTTVYAKCSDAAGNESGQSTLTISNIDKTAPIVSFGTNGGSDLEIASTTVTVSDTGGSNVNTSTLQYVWDTQNTVTPSSGWTTFTNGATITKSEEGTYYLWVKASDNAGNNVATKTNSFTIIVETSDFGVGVIATDNVTIDGAVPAYNNPIIPKGFKAIEDGAIWPTGWNDGLVIEDIDGNQFVWVPVNGTSIKYEKWDPYYYYDDEYKIEDDYLDDTLPLGVTDETSQITNYGGFYIARFEAAKQSEDTIGNLLVSKRGATAWNNLNYIEAKYKAELMYDTNDLKSGLVTGRQYDSLMQWIESKYQYMIYEGLYWGNYRNSQEPGGGNIQTTGFSEVWKVNNIYDIAGNVGEWTNERTSWGTTNRIHRGGSYNDYGDYYEVNYRSSSNMNYSYEHRGFRVALYIIEENENLSTPVISANTYEWTNDDVTVTITYPQSATVKQYSLNGTTWNNYTGSITITENDTIVYAKCSDGSGNNSNQATLKVVNIDRETPTVEFSPDGGVYSFDTVSTTITVKDTGGSHLNSNTLQYVWDTQNTVTPSSGWTTFTNGETITKIDTAGTYYLWVKASDNAGNSLVDKSSSFEMRGIVPEYTALGLGVIATNHTTFDGNKATYNNPIIPKGFKAINDGAVWPTDWNSGLVIEDANGNQFVWVPVDGTNVEYEKWDPYYYYYDDEEYNIADEYPDDTLPLGITNEKLQVNDYEGFYIARFEAGNQSNAVVSKRNVPVWNNLNYDDSKYKAEIMYNTESVKSGLVTGRQYDSLMQWIDNAHPYMIYEGLYWGNFSDSQEPGGGVLQTAGFSEVWKAKNIYDIAGNVSEWTNEKVSWNTTSRVNRGGSYNSYGEYYEVFYRSSLNKTNTHDYRGFRTALYIIASDNPVITATPSVWTNDDVTITIAYPAGSTMKQYSYNGTDWSNYTGALTVSENDTIIYAKCIDSLGNETGISTYLVANIDRETPTVEFGINGGHYSFDTSSTPVTVSDTGGSYLNESTLQYVWDTQNTVTPSSGWTTFTNGQTITNVTTAGTYYLWIRASDNAGNTVVDKSNAFEMGGVTPDYTALGTDVIATSNTTFDGNKATYNNPIIPKGFKAVNDGAVWPTDWNDGLVIEDINGNQFVWVPIDATNVSYEKWDPYYYYYGDDGYNIEEEYPDDILPLGVVSERLQINDYEGFYIARFEAGNENNGLVSKRNVPVWNNLNYDDSKYKAERMYDTESIKSGLVTGRQYDSLMQWIDKAHPYMIYEGYYWGNYSDSEVPGGGVLQTAGFSEVWKAKNIYDIAGNVSEWTNEKVSWNTTSRVNRGGSYNDYGYYYEVFYRSSLNKTNTHDYRGFRVALYIIASNNPVISADPSGWTNGDVTVTITYPPSSTMKQYSFNGTNWSNYTGPITISTNNTPVYAKCVDALGNQTGQSTIMIANIDKVTPTVAFGINGGDYSFDTVSTPVTVSDTGGSYLNESTLQYVWDTQNTVTPSSGWTTFTNGQTIAKTGTAATYYLWIRASDNAGNTVVTKSNGFVVGGITPEYTALGTDVIATSNTTVNGAVATYNNPIIPKGFKAINDGTVWPTDWDKGLVIEDTNGNQFVWVPIDEIDIPYEKWDPYYYYYGDEYDINEDYIDDTLPSGVLSERMQINDYKGFYVARYEAGKEGTSTVVSKKNATVWNSINYTNAKTRSQSMYNTGSVKSGLITGTQYDSLMRWLTIADPNALYSGTYWGNFTDSNETGAGSLQTTGFSEVWKKNNMYDLAGNVAEWTSEIPSWSTGSRIYRGGQYNYYGDYDPINYRDYSSSTSTNVARGFRVVLYVLHE